MSAFEEWFDLGWPRHPPPTDERHPLHWQHEYTIDFVLGMYEQGRVVGFTVDHAQECAPKLSWRVGRRPAAVASPS